MLRVLTDFGSLAVAGLGDVTQSRLERRADLREDGHVQELVETRVTFPAGGLRVESEVIAVVRLDGSITGFVTEISPFHPGDPHWPDQGADRGTVTIDGVVARIVDVVLGATQGMNLLTATNIPVRPGEPGWVFVVVHLLDAGSRVPMVGQQVRLDVDAAHRESLCFGHTACHIASLALNAALADRWRKPVPEDGLGHPNFDQIAIASSRIRPDGATDVYRLGKSLRKRGFDAVDLPVGAVEVAVNEILARWVGAGATISIETEGDGLTDRRTWVCDLPDGQERIACGGTHLTSLAGVASIVVGLTPGDAELTLETHVMRA